MILPKRGLFCIAIIAFVCMINSYDVTATNLPDPYLTDPPKITTDTIPVEDNTGDFINDPLRNPFDIVPSNVTQSVEYDATSGKYILTEKIGDEYYRMPTYMTFQEYVDWREKEDQKKYFAKLAGVSVGKNKGSALEDPMAQIDVANSLVDRLFGGTEVNIQPQGQVDVTMRSGATRTTQINGDPIIGRQNNSPWQIRAIDPDVGIRVSVDGKIGTKMNLNFNYDTQSTFDFDRKIKLEYDTEAFGEDDIIKKIEAGNVSLPLRSNLIQGAQSLFGLKTELQFGHLRLTGIVSQQQSEQKSITIENGASIQEFELSPDDFDENRHFFLSHFHRDNFEVALENLPQVNSSFRIADIEVWISDNRPRTNNLERATLIAGLTDLAEDNLDNYNNTKASYQNFFGPSETFDQDLIATITDIEGTNKIDTLPDNRNNKIYSFIEKNDDVEDEDQVKAILAARGMEVGDFASFQGRKLTRSEYSVNEQLGFISLNIRLRPDQNLSVAYNYYYSQSCRTGEPQEGQPTYQVGQLSVNNTTYATLPQDPNQIGQDSTAVAQESSKVLFTKLLKSAVQPTDKPSYDLMMKNVYPLRASQLDPQEFSFDIFYEDDRDGTLKKFLPVEALKFTPLLNLFNLDRLNKFNDPQPDGVFDFVPGVTIIPNTGTVVFPVLEPFGEGLGALVEKELERKGNLQAKQIATLVDSVYGFPKLYNNSLTQARQNLEQNKFLMKGFVKSNGSGDINLGSFISPGSVTVRAGGVELIEGADYEIDYSLGRLRIINDSYLQQGTPINVNFEDQTVFSLQQKNMMGLRADYNLSKKASIGATMLKLSERPFTQKVNIGNDPISNVIYGADFSYSSEAPGLTKILDKLPLYSTNEPSSINFYAEAAYLRPGYSSAIGLDSISDSVVSIDDFEGAINGVQLGGFNSQAWRLASTPSNFPEGKLTNDLNNGANRARLSWNSLDRLTRGDDPNSSYTRFVDQTDIFDRDVQIGQSELVTFDLNYYPQERGPYNFDLPNGTPVSAGINIDSSELAGSIILNNPEDRWAGIMRPFQNTDFEAANYEFIEFWLLNPYMDRPDNIDHNPMEEGKMVIQLGTISEDILKDGSQMYENGLPTDVNSVDYKSTTWGRANTVVPFINGFDINNGEAQDVGYDGIKDSLERVHYQNYLQELEDNSLMLTSVFLDPSGDNFVDVDDEMWDPNLSILQRIKLLSNPEGNSPLGSTNTSSFRGNRFPDTEDMNNNRSLDGDLGEGYYEYEIPIYNQNGQIDEEAAKKYITDKVEVVRPNGPNENWYRVRVPIADFDSKTNISGLRSIQFMRMYVTGFKTPKTFRLGEFQILRNLWRRNSDCMADGQDSIIFTVDEVGIQENSNRAPFPYMTPSNVKQERLQSTFANLLQDEKSMSLRFDVLAKDCQIGVNKLAELDLTLYDKMQMFVHAEANLDLVPDADDNQLYAYIKIGKDLTNHFYEYEIPLILSDENKDNNVANIWPDSNLMTVPIKAFTKAKQIRIAEGDPLNEIFSRALNTLPFEEFANSTGTINIKGTPSLSRIKIVEIGVKNKRADGTTMAGEVWMNELRLLGLNQKSALAGEARMQVVLADLGDFNATASYSANGWGALDQRLAERNRKELVNYDLATSLKLDKFFPEKWGLSIPFYAQYSKETANLQFEPYEGDLTVEEKTSALEERIGNINNQQEIDSLNAEIEDVKDRSKEQTTIKTFNFTNVKKTSTGSPKPWSPSNVSVSYAYTETVKSDPIIKEDKTVVHNTQLDYNYSKKASYIQPFKKVKSKHLKIIKEINFNPLPNSFTFGTNIMRSVNSRLFRLPVEPEFFFDDKRYFWNRDYGLNWDLTKSLKFNFKAKAESIVDELRQVGIAENRDLRDWQDEKGEPVDFGTNSVVDSVSNYRWNNLKELGRSKNYNHNFSLTYNLPIRYLPYMDWVTAKADYKGSYSWNAGSLQEIDVDGNTQGNTISNQNAKSINATFSFDKLYSKSKYLKAIDKGKKKSRRASRSKSKSKNTVDGAKAEQKSRKNKKKDTGPTTLERVLLRPLLALRNIKASYKEDVSTTLPGFMVGVDGSHGLLKGFSEPGFGFLAGGQQNIRPTRNGDDELDNWLTTTSQNGWWNKSTQFNSLFTQTKKQTANIRIALEPIRNLDIDLEFKKSYTENYTDQFKFQEIKGTETGSFIQDFGIETGSYNFTHLGGINTLFGDATALYEQFSSERQDVSLALATEDDNENFTLHQEFEGYYQGYGPENSEVSVPAFLKTYTGRDFDPQTSLLDQVKKSTFIPAPNWSVKYDGLSKLSIFKDLISSFSIRHAYTGTTTVGSFESNILFIEDLTLRPQSLSSNGNYQSEFNLPGLRIVDQFSPLIGFSLKLKNEMTFEGGMNKSRTLNLTQLNLSESLSTEITFGFGYTLKNFRSGGKKKNKKRGKRGQKDEKEKDKDPLTGRQKKRGKVDRSRGKTLTMNLDIAYGDNLENIYNLGQRGDAQIPRGSTSLVINPNVDYDVNKNLTMRFFVNYSNITTKTTLGVSTLDINAGVTAQLKIN